MFYQTFTETNLLSSMTSTMDEKSMFSVRLCRSSTRAYPSSLGFRLLVPSSQKTGITTMGTAWYTDSSTPSRPPWLTNARIFGWPEIWIFRVNGRGEIGFCWSYLIVIGFVMFMQRLLKYRFCLQVLKWISVKRGFKEYFHLNKIP